MHVKKLAIGDPFYPERLQHIYDPPVELYYVGNLEILKRPLVAIVGTRRMTGYGESQAFRFAKELSQQGICIVSGLAYGIDKTAHEGALAGIEEGATIAVLAQALPNIQPAVHQDLARRIVAKGGLLLSESPKASPNFKSAYLIRNRIIAGLCLGTLVVEAPLKSGAMNTAHHALENNREVLAIPGRLTDEWSRGTNDLIQRGAHLVVTPKDVMLVLKLSWKARTVQLEGAAARIFEVLKQSPRSPAELGDCFEGSMVELYEILGELELQGLIRFTKELRYTVSSDVCVR